MRFTVGQMEALRPEERQRMIRDQLDYQSRKTHEAILRKWHMQMKERMLAYARNPMPMFGLRVEPWTCAPGNAGGRYGFLNPSKLNGV